MKIKNRKTEGTNTINKLIDASLSSMTMKGDNITIWVSFGERTLELNFNNEETEKFIQWLISHKVNKETL